MKFQVWMIRFALCVGAILPMSFAAAQNTANSNENQQRTTQTVLVMKNGQVLTGQLSRDTTHVFVQTRTGSRLVIPASQVDFVCDSLEQAYWKRLARIRATDVEGQVQLFYWCLNHQLVDQARNQIDLLQEMDIPATRLEFLHRQLTVAQNRPTGSDSLPSDQPRDLAANRRNSSTGPTNRSSPHSGPTIRQVGYDAEPGVSKEIERQRRLQAMEKTIDRLSRATVGDFKRRVEPLLVRTCYDCHSDTDGPMPLRRLGLNQVIPRRMSQLNLIAALGQIDSATPQTSPLWLASTQPHADLQDPLITPGTVPYQNLMEWVVNASAELRSTGGDTGEMASSLAAADDRPTTAAPDSQANVTARGQNPKRSSAPLTIAPRGMYPGINATAAVDSSATPLPAIPPVDASTTSPAPDIPRLSPVQPRRQASADPFDPTEFNQRFARPSNTPRR